jgi:hypothetical protein
MEKQVKIKIRPDGTFEIEAVNFKGDGCAKATSDFTKALGVTKKSEQKPEYNETENRNDGCQTQQGF